MKRHICLSLVILILVFPTLFAQEEETINRIIEEVVVTGTRIPVPRDVIPVPITVVSRKTIEQSEETSLQIGRAHV